MKSSEILDEAPASESSRRPKSGPRILVLFSDIGEGHLSAARTLRDDIEAEAPDADVVLENGFDALGRLLCWFMRDFYRANCSSLPRLYRLGYELFRRVWLFRHLGVLILNSLGGRGVLRLVESHPPDLVVSTDARLNAVLGHLKRIGSLQVPVLATLTDIGGLEFWAHKGVDLHLVMDSSCVAPVERLAGKGAARQVRPLVAPAFFRPLSRAEARRGLDLPADRKIVLISGGGWGVGDLEGAIRAVLALPDTHAVCLTGHNNQARIGLEAGFAGQSRLQVLGFTSHMNELIAACDVVVHAMGGITYLEAQARGRPVIAYKPPSGHPTLIASSLARQGRQRVAKTQEQLSEALLEAFAQPAEIARCYGSVPSAAATILNAPRRVFPRSTWQKAALRLSVAALLVVLIGSFVFFADDSYPVLAKTLHLRSAHPAAEPATVQLVIRAAPDIVPAALQDLAAHGSTASFVVLDTASVASVRAIETSGDQVVLGLDTGSRIGWVHTRRSLADEAARAGIGRTTVYLPPKDGLTLSEYLLARSAGAVPIRGATWLLPGRSGSLPAMRGGSTVVLDLGSGSAPCITFLDHVLANLGTQGLTAVPLALPAGDTKA